MLNGRRDSGRSRMAALWGISSSGWQSVCSSWGLSGSDSSVYSWLFSSSGARDWHSEGTVGGHGRAVGTVVALDPRDNGSCARKLAPARTRFSTGGAGRHQGESSSCAVHKSSKPAGKSRVVVPAWPPKGTQPGSGAPRHCSPSSEHFGMVRHPILEFRPAGRSTELPLTRVDR